MEFKEHCKECQEKLGKDWDVVHIWLDGYAKKIGVPWHRVMRHHQEGIEEVRGKWGDEAAKAAELHILSDFPDLGFVPTEAECDCLVAGGQVVRRKEHDDGQ